MAEAKREEEKILSIEEGREKSAEGAGGESAAGDPPPAGEAALSAELAKVRAEKEDLLQTLVRRQADFENFRKRTER
ncbi:MAG: nucleotide exchange factor GrpE, partial [Candidatus Acidiferrales bacterium]